MILKIIGALFSLLFLFYLLLPGPNSIVDFPSLPDSFKSQAEGDTIQVPNVSAYFSFDFRDFVVPFYQKKFQQNTWFPFPPFRLNYPPEFAYKAIKDQTESTYLEELVYPFRQSLFINGMEPFNPDGTPRWEGAKQFGEDGRNFNTKTTLRFYSSSIWTRILFWIGINTSLILLYLSGKKVIYG